MTSWPLRVLLTWFQSWQIQPSPTSSDIITTKPRMEVQDASFPFPLVGEKMGKRFRNREHITFSSVFTLYHLNPFFFYPPDLSFRYDVVHHHVNHCPGSKRQCVWQQRFCEYHSEGTQQPSNGLHHATELTVPAGRTATLTVTWLSPRCFVQTQTQVFPYQKAVHVETPDPRSGRLTAKPSGKFWMPIPMAKFLMRQKKN